MHRVIRSGELQPSPGGTVTFEGDPYGSGVSLFLVNNEPGQGRTFTSIPTPRPGSSAPGKVRFRADGEDIEAGHGDILVVGSETPHKFKNAGTERLDIICIHASPRMIQAPVEE
jgi:hypothetical protein